MAGPFVVARNGVVIGAPAQRVFDYLADMTLHGEWNPEPDFQVTGRPDVPPGVGTVWRREKNGVMRGPLIIRGGMSDNPVKIVKIMTITAYEPYQGLVFETRNSYNGLLASIERATFNLAAQTEGTRVAMVSEVEPMVPSAYIGPVYAIRAARAAFERLIGNRLTALFPKATVGPYLAKIKDRLETNQIAGKT
jgi:uncharacterized protein YndB with AHSA1/START domain